MMGDLARIDISIDSRAATFENPTGARGAGGTVADGRKGAPSRLIEVGERVALLDATGPGLVRHIWMAHVGVNPTQNRSLRLEVYYEGALEPSVAVPLLDFFGLPHGRRVPFASALVAANEGYGLNSWIPMPFRRHIRIALVNESAKAIQLAYQIDYSQERVPDDSGYLHVTFRRENPTTLQRDFTIVDGLPGPGRFLGCVIGVRVLDTRFWYGEGEVKVYRDGDGKYPTICGTGLEDYVLSGAGLAAHHAPYSGAPMCLGPDQDRLYKMPELVGFYRWHVADPIVYSRELRVTIQQIGAAFFRPERISDFRAFSEVVEAAGGGWHHDPKTGIIVGLYERSDDYSAAAFVYCTQPVPVEIPDPLKASADLERRPWESNRTPVDDLIEEGVAENLVPLNRSTTRTTPQ